MNAGSLILRLCAIATFLLCQQSPAVAQLFEFCDDFVKDVRLQREPYEERIETERHDFTQSAVTVGRGVFQVEGGYSFFYKDTGEEIESSHTTPEMLFRVGLSEDIELRLRTNYAWQLIDEHPDVSGSEDLRVSVKLQLTRPPECEESCIPTSAVEIRGTVPTGSETWSTNQAEFGLDYIYQWEIAEGTTLAASTGWGTNGFGDFGLVPELPASESFNVLTQSVALGCELSDQNTMYAEWFGIYSDNLTDEFSISVFNLGVDHYVTDNIVVDIRVGKGLSDDSDDFFCGVGGGVRY